MNTVPHSPDPGTAQRKLLAVTGGGTGGHTMPALSVAAKLTSAGHDVVYYGSSEGLERAMASEAGIDYVTLKTGKFPTGRAGVGLAVRYAASLVAVARGTITAARAMRRARPDALLATGGFVSVPASLAARALNIPVVLHEQTIAPGLANRLIARVASTIALTWEGTELSPAPRAPQVVTGNPIRDEILAGQASRALQRFFGAAATSGPVLLVLGGSQGSARLNDTMWQTVGALDSSIKVIHQTGLHRDNQRRNPIPTGGNYHPVSFLGAQEMGDALALADVVISRSGAGTINELAATRKPAVLVPLQPSRADEQMKLARHYQRIGSADIVTQDELTPATLLAAIARRLERPGPPPSAGDASRPDPTERLCSVLLAAEPRR